MIEAELAAAPNASDDPPSDLGSADLHIHTLASDGVSGVDEVLAAAVARGLDVIAVTDHERIDAAIVARRLARDRNLPLRVVVGEEVTTRNGHLIGLFMTQRIKPWGTMRDAVVRIHDQGGICIVAHPLVPYPLCASEGTIRRMLDDGDPMRRPDAIEAFNPTTAGMRWSQRVPAFVDQVGLAAVASSDAHHAGSIGRAVTRFRGTSEDDLRAAILSRTTMWEGVAYGWSEQVGMFGQQLAKNGRAIRDTVRHRLLGQGTGRDLGYPR